MGEASRWATTLDLRRAIPRRDVASSGYGLAEPRRESLVSIPACGSSAPSINDSEARPMTLNSTERVSRSRQSGSTWRRTEQFALNLFMDGGDWSLCRFHARHCSISRHGPSRFQAALAQRHIAAGTYVGLRPSQAESGRSTVPLGGCLDLCSNPVPVVSPRQWSAAPTS